MTSKQKPAARPQKRSRPTVGARAERPAKKQNQANNQVIRSAFQQSLFNAAFGPRDDDMFENACATELQRALGASATALIWLSGTRARRTTFATSQSVKLFAEHTRARGLVKRCLHTRVSATVTIGATDTQFKAHDRAALKNGWKQYLCLPLSASDGSAVGAALVYFASKTDLHAKAKLFNTQLHALLTDAIRARPAFSQNTVTTNQFSSLAQTIPGVVYQRIVRPDGDIRYTYLSEGARELFGVAPEAVLQDPEVLFRTYTDDYKQNFRQRLLEASQTLTKWDVEASFIMPNGRRRTTHAIAQPERLGDGSVLWTGVILDASRAKEAEDSLKEANRLVGLANESKSAFLAKMSHEMRTPLNGVLGMGDLLLKTELSQRQMRLATTLCDSAKGLLGLINDVLDLSRVEAGEFKLDVQDFNLRHCVEDAVELCAMSGYRKGLEVNLITAPDTPIGVKSDPVRIRQILINLIGNAVKFTESGEVTIRLTAEQQASGACDVTFEIADTGIGIAPTAIGRLFEPFAQADATISRRFGGTGLGLSITRHLVELLGGKVTLTSELGRGTTVRIVIPFAVTASAQTPSIAGQVLLDGLRILVVDDRATNREMMGTNLADSRARIEAAASEADALDRLSAAAKTGDPYKVAVIDRITPRSSGLHLCRTIRANPLLAETAIVALMSPNWNADQADQKGLTKTVFLSKPARRADLLVAVGQTQCLDSASRLAQRNTAAHMPTQAPAAPALHLRVLLVEDNATNIEVALEYLSELQCRVTVATNGIEALGHYDRARFDIILMDSQIPELDGLSTTRRIRASERQRDAEYTPIIAVTANAYDSDRIQALEAGSDDFLSKPFTDMQLRGMLQKWAAKSSAAAARSTGVPDLAATNTATMAASVATASAHSAKPDSQTSDTEQFDDAMHTVLLQSRPAFLGRLLAAFLSSVPETLTTLRSALATDDAELLQMLAHSIKSAGANVGAKRLSEVCKVLEVKLRFGTTLADCRALGASVETELIEAEVALQELLGRLSKYQADAATG